MSLQNRKSMNRMSDKKLASLGGRAFSTIARVAMKLKPRPKAETVRIYGEEYSDYIRSLPCYFCGRIPSVQAHLKSGGTGRKDDAERTLPMCPSSGLTGYIGCHDRYDGAKVSFPISQGTTREALFVAAAELYAGWQEARC